PVFAYCGFWAWNLTANSLKFAVGSLTSNTNLVQKVYFPRELLPLSAVVVSFVDFLVASLLLVAFMLYYRIGVGPSLVVLPAILRAQLLLTAAIALVVAMANLFYRDIKYLFEIVLTVWMFASAVVYPAGLIGGQLGALVQLNPMTPIIEGYRSVLLRAE